MTAPSAVPLTVTEHFPANSVHIFEENVTSPVPETFIQVMVPVCVEEGPDTVEAQVIDVPTARVDLVHVTVVCVGAFVTIRLKEAEAGEFCLSPWYFAVMVTGEFEVVGMYMTEQAPFTSWHVVLENLPGLLLDQDKLPLGVDPGLWIVPLHSEAVPRVTEAFTQETVNTVPLVVVVVWVVVLEPDPQSNVPCGSAAKLPPTLIWSFESPPPCALPSIPQAVP